MTKLRIVTLRFGAGATGPISMDNSIGTGYNHGEGNRRTSRNGRVSDFPAPEIPNITVRSFFIALTHHVRLRDGFALVAAHEAGRHLREAL
jgi:hypothetical protein